jgi:hypothetical protein
MARLSAEVEGGVTVSRVAVIVGGSEVTLPVETAARDADAPRGRSLATGGRWPRAPGRSVPAATAAARAAGAPTGRCTPAVTVGFRPVGRMAAARLVTPARCHWQWNSGLTHWQLSEVS